MELQTVSQVSKALGISAQMLRYYERSGLVESLRKENYAYRVYDAENIKRLQQIAILRKLQIPMKQIKGILENQNSAEVIEVFRHNISELEEQITALSDIRLILTRLVDELHDEANVQLKLERLNDKTMFALIGSLSFPENKIKGEISMDKLSKANEVLEKANEKKPAIVVYQSYKDEFLFLGVEQVVTPNTDFGMVWDTYFKAVEKASIAIPYSHIIWYYKNGKQVYFVGNMVASADEIPTGYSAVLFPACEYLVVTHEWLPEGEDLYSSGIMLTQNYCGIGQTHYPCEGMQIPEGYARFDSPNSFITQIEVENKSKYGIRFERWIPIKKLDSSQANVSAMR